MYKYKYKYIQDTTYRETGRCRCKCMHIVGHIPETENKVHMRRFYKQGRILVNGSQYVREADFKQK